MDTATAELIKEAEAAIQVMPEHYDCQGGPCKSEDYDVDRCLSGEVQGLKTAIEELRVEGPRPEAPMLDSHWFTPMPPSPGIGMVAVDQGDGKWKAYIATYSIF